MYKIIKKNEKNLFVFSGTNWKDNSCDVIYNKLPFRVKCRDSRKSPSDIMLLVYKEITEGGISNHEREILYENLQN